MQTILTEERPISAESQPTRLRSFERPVVIALSVFALLALVLSLVDPRATLVSDTGGKTATLASMAANDDWSVDIGYWAEEQDPDGSLAPYFSTYHYGDQWVQVTTLPMVMAARPLYAVGGHRAALILPMLGVVMTALGAGAVHRELGDETGAVASWTVGLAGPAFVYGLDFWEHSVGLAFMVWGTVWLLRTLGFENRTVRLAAFAGLCFGAAATMRQEALIYGFVAGLVLAWNSRSSLRLLVTRGASFAGAAALVLVANMGLERVVLGASQRSDRAAGVLASHPGNAESKFYDVLLEFSGPAGIYSSEIILPAALFVVGLAWLGLAIRRNANTRNPAIVVMLAYLFVAIEQLSHGLGFVPGLLVVAPFAGLALITKAQSQAAAQIWLVAFGAFPLVAYFQYPGGIAPQWGGRLLLTTSVLLTVLGIDLVVKTKPKVFIGLLAAASVVGLLGVAWTIQRSQIMGDTVTEIAEIDAPVTVFWDPVFARESGPLVLDEQWLTVTTEEDRIELPIVLAGMGVEEFVYVVNSTRDSVTFEGFTEGSTEDLYVFEGLELSLIRYTKLAQ